MAARFPTLTMRLPEAELAAVAPHRMEDRRQFARHWDRRALVPAVALQLHSPRLHVHQRRLLSAAESWTWWYCTAASAEP
jgi:hypothetical protein